MAAVWRELSAEIPQIAGAHRHATTDTQEVPFSESGALGRAATTKPARSASASEVAYRQPTHWPYGRPTDSPEASLMGGAGRNGDVRYM